MPDPVTKDFDISKAFTSLKEEIGKAIEAKASIETIDKLRDELKTMQTDLVAKVDNMEGDLVAKILSQIEQSNDAKVFDWTEFEQQAEGKFGKTVSWSRKELSQELARSPTLLSKDYASNEAVVGGVQTALGAYHNLVAGNPLRPYQTVLAVSGGTVTIPRLFDIQFNNEQNIPAARTKQGNVGDGTPQTVKNWTAEGVFSDPVIEDVPLLDQVIELEYMQQYGKKQGEEAAAVIKASVANNAAGNFAAVTTGVAAALPATGDVIAKMADLKAAIGSAYLAGAIYVVSKELEARVISGNASNIYAFDVPRGITTLFGYPLIRFDYADAGSAANQVSGYFGNFRRGLYLCERTSLELNRYMETNPGSVTYFGRGRFSQFKVDGDAVAGLVTKV